MGPLRAELLKAWRSWATTILIVIVALVELLLGYLVIWLIVQVPADQGGVTEVERAALLATLGADRAGRQCPRHARRTWRRAGARAGRADVGP